MATKVCQHISYLSYCTTLIIYSANGKISLRVWVKA